jgi:hypothetical protein
VGGGKMKTYQKIVAYGALVAGSLGLFGCSNNPPTVTRKNLIGFGQTSVAIGDVTGNGKRDIVYADKNGIHYLENLGNGKFGEPVPVGLAGSLGLGQVTISVGDITGNSLEDIVIGSKVGISVLENQGEGEFKPLE